MDQLMGLPPGGLLSIVIGLACLAAIFLLYVKLQGIMEAVLHGASAERSALADVLSRLASQMEQLVQLQQEAVALLKEPPAAPCVASSVSAVYEDQRDPADERIQQEAAQLHLDDSAAKALRRRQEATVVRQDAPGRAPDGVSEELSVAAAAGTVGIGGAALLLGDELLAEEPLAGTDSFRTPPARQQPLDAEVPPLQQWEPEVSAAPWFTQSGPLDQLAQPDLQEQADSLGQPDQPLHIAHDLDLEDLVHDDVDDRPSSDPPLAPSGQAHELLWEDESEAFSTQLGGEDVPHSDFDHGASDAAHLDAPAFEASLDDDIWDQAPASLGSTMGRSANGARRPAPAEGSAGNLPSVVNLDDINVMDSMTFEETTIFNGQFRLPGDEPVSPPEIPLEAPAAEQITLPDFDDEPLVFEAPELDEDAPILASEQEHLAQGHSDHDFRLDDEEQPDDLAADLLEALPDDLGAVYGEDLEAAGEYIVDETGGDVADDPDSRTWEFGDELDLEDDVETAAPQALSPPTAQDLHQDLSVGHAGPVYRDATPAREASRAEMQAFDMDRDGGAAMGLDFDLALPEGLEPLPDHLEAEDLDEDEGQGPHNIMAKLMEDGVPASAIPAPPEQVLPAMVSDAHVLDAAFEEEISFDEEYSDHDSPSGELATGPAAGADEPMFVMEDDGELVLDFDVGHAPAVPETQAAAMTAALDEDDLLFDMPEVQPLATSTTPGAEPEALSAPAVAAVDASAYEDDLLFLDDEEELPAPSASQPLPPELEVDFGLVEFEEATPEPAQGPQPPQAHQPLQEQGAAMAPDRAEEDVEDVLVFVDDELPDAEAMTALFDSGDLLEFEPDLLDPATPAAMTARGEALDEQLQDFASFEPTIMPDPDRRGLGPVHEDPLERDIAALEDMISFDEGEDTPAVRTGGAGRRNSNITDFIED